jgi:hypothetical protein
MEQSVKKQAAATVDLGRLNQFSGIWHTEGEMKGSCSGQPAKFTATDSYEWLPGGYFLLHRFDADMPDGNVKGIEVIGYSQESNSYPMHSFDSLGRTSMMQARVEEDRWTFTGEDIRFTGRFLEIGTVFTGLWERHPGEGAAWQPWMKVRLRKVE